ncbi:MAG TPA: DoxX family protein [Candidatus Saccharimonadales bacterium]|nr:DoxX family protein [Candidatus Saccharimonadales bacterium]
MKKIFSPGNDSALTSLALLVLRLWIGLTMMLNHGLDKMTHFDKYSQHFISFMGLGPSASLCLSIFAEFFASALLVLGLFTRFGALTLTINMSVAFIMVHKMALSGPMPGELAFIYLAVYVTLLVAGPGKISLDRIVFGKNK